METIFKSLKWITSLATIAGVVLTAYFYLHKERVTLEVKAMSVQLLTAATSTEDLRVEYFYKDTIPVQNLWQIQYVIRNIGDATLVGTGEGKQLLSKNLPFSIKNEHKIYHIAITQANNDATLSENQICFKQWRSGEFVEITGFVESIEPPQLIISDRDIKDSKIVFQTYTPEIINENAKIIDFFPKWFIKTILAIYYIIVGFITLGAIIAFIQKNTWVERVSLIMGLLFFLIPLLWMI